MSRFTVTTAILIAVLASSTLAFGINPNKEPWCNFPSFFHGSLKSSPAFVDPTKDLEGDWYTIGYKKQSWKYCQCAMQSFAWNAEKNRVDTWFGCETKRANKYTNVKLYSKNENNTEFGGWMRFSKDGWFWIPFNYWILDVAADKSWFVLGEPCRKMVFLASRTKAIDDATYQGIKA